MLTSVFVFVVVAGSLSEAFYNPYKLYNAVPHTAVPLGSAHVSYRRVAGSPLRPTLYTGGLAVVQQYVQIPQRPQQYAHGILRAPQYAHASLVAGQYAQAPQGTPTYAQGPIGIGQFAQGPVGTVQHVQGQMGPGQYGASPNEAMTYSNPYTPGLQYAGGFYNHINPLADARYGHGGILITYDYPDIPDRSKKVDY